MTALAIALTVLMGLVALVWASRHVMISREHRKGFALGPDYPGPPEEPPLLSVLVAAKDEAAVIEACVRTMLDQDYARFELIVCNDRSTDETAAIVERIAADDDRVRLINIEHLPAGWCGKNNAMQTGIASARGEWICMIDADCRQTSRRTLSTAVQYAFDTGADMLSVLPQLEISSFWESVIQPVASGVMMIWFRPDRVNDPRRPAAYANGAFMLIKRSVYEAIGTHAAVRASLNEDMHMARLVKSAGHTLRVVRSHGLYLVRMYTSFGQILRGWSRIFFGTFGTLRRLSVSLAVVLVISLGPYLAAATGLSLGAAGGADAWAWWMLGWAGLGAVAVQLSVIYRFYGLLEASRALFWTYPLGCAIVTIALIKSLAKLLPGAKVVWKSTSYKSGQ